MNSKNFLGNIPHGKVINQGLSTTTLDIDSCIYAPKAASQFNVETFGSQNSNAVNQDIVIEGTFAGVRFIQVTANNLVNDSGIVALNPTVNSKMSNIMLFQGYNVMDGDLQ